MLYRAQMGWIAGLCLLASCAWAESETAAPETAEPPVVTAHEVVQDTTQRVMAAVTTAREYVDVDPERYYREVQEILDPVIDFRGFARNVMGPYASSKRYRSLDKSGKAQLRDQLDRFTEVMRVGLVRTYGKGLLAFGGSRIEISKPQPDEMEQSRVSVRQLVFSEEVEPYEVMYQMGRNKSGTWKLRNVIIESVNLGEIYRNQFQAAARKHEGNLDTVIKNWSAVSIET